MQSYPLSTSLSTLMPILFVVSVMMLCPLKSKFN